MRERDRVTPQVWTKTMRTQAAMLINGAEAELADITRDPLVFGPARRELVATAPDMLLAAMTYIDELEDHQRELLMRAQRAEQEVEQLRQQLRVFPDRRYVYLVAGYLHSQPWVKPDTTPHEIVDGLSEAIARCGR